MLWYIELKSGGGHRGTAWIGRVSRSRTGQTIYFNGRALKRIKGGGISANYYDLETRDEYWVSGVKRDGSDRHWAGGGKIVIDAGVVAEYLAFTGRRALDPARYEISVEIRATDPQRFTELENARREASEPPITASRAAGRKAAGTRPS